MATCIAVSDQKRHFIFEKKLAAFLPFPECTHADFTFLDVMPPAVAILLSRWQKDLALGRSYGLWAPE